MKLTLNDILVKRDEALADVRKSGKRIKTLTATCSNRQRQQVVSED